MVEFIEKYGDLSKPQNSPHGRQWCMHKWRQLRGMLNNHGIAESRIEEKCRKMETEAVEGEKIVSMPGEPQNNNLLIAQLDKHIVGDEDWNTPGSHKDPGPIPPMLRSITPPLNPKLTTPPMSHPLQSPPRSPVAQYRQKFPQPPPQRHQRKTSSVKRY